MTSMQENQKKFFNYTFLQTNLLRVRDIK